MPGQPPQWLQRRYHAIASLLQGKTDNQPVQFWRANCNFFPDKRIGIVIVSGFSYYNNFSGNFFNQKWLMHDKG